MRGQLPTVTEDAVVSSVIPHSAKMKPGGQGQNTVLLKTAKAWVGGPSGSKVARCLLDGGSQRNFIHENLVRSLNLADCYWQIVSEKAERLTETLVALESTFGWSGKGPVSTSSVTVATCKCT